MAEARYLLDTTILSDLVKRPAGPVARKIAAVGEDTVCTSIIVACELRYGVAKKGSAALANKIESLLAVLGVLPLETGADARYGEVRHALEKAGNTIGGNDLLIAAHTLALGLTLVTDNVAEFSRVEGLTVENWLREQER